MDLVALIPLLLAVMLYSIGGSVVASWMTYERLQRNVWNFTWRGFALNLVVFVYYYTVWPFYIRAAKRKADAQ